MSSYIRQNFETDTDKVRAIYLWVTNNIGYDVPRFLARDREPKKPPQTTKEVFTSKYAVCQGYSELFVELCSKTGIKAFIVSGYTKKNGMVSPISHAWVAAVLDGEWNLFDPMFQLRSYPLTNRKFIEGLPASGKSIFNFNDSIQQHTQLTPELQFAAELRRMEAAGLQNSVLYEHKDYLKQRLQSIASKDAFYEGQAHFKYLQVYHF